MMSLEEHILDIQDKLNNNKYPNEQAISQGVVLRLLETMGWPIYEPTLVIPEYRVNGRRVDFALCTQSDKPMIFIEVKQLGNTLGADKQVFEYAYHKGVPFAIVTDGREWHFYLPAEVGNYDERKVYVLDLVERNVRESLEHLQRYLSFNEVESGKALENAREDYKNVSRERRARENIPEAWRKLIKEGDEILIESVSEKVEALCGFKPAQQQVLSFLKLLEPNSAITETRITPSEGNHPSPKQRKQRKKIKVTFPDGDEIYESVVAKMFVRVIRKIGAEKVRSLNIQQAGYPLISEQEYKDKGQWAAVDSGLYVNTRSNTDVKCQHLCEINRKLNLGLKIVPK